MTQRQTDPFIERYWPLLLIACGGLILWYTIGGNGIAGGAGFLGIGWLAWEKLIKSNM